MDGTSVPHHRNATPPAPVLMSPSKPGRFRALFTSSSGGDEQFLLQRKPSGRSHDYHRGQLDGQPSEESDPTPRPGSKESRRSSLSQRLSDQMDNLSAKLNGTAGTQTIVHRAGSRRRQSIPHIDIRGPSTPVRAATEAANMATPSIASSSTPADNTWSPASTASTGATSWASPLSSKPGMRNGNSPEFHNFSKSVSAGADDGFLPPIQEDSGRYVVIPVQDEPIEAHPSIVTVENVAAAKVYFETHFHKLLMEPSSPRSLRLKKFEQHMADLGLSHDQRLDARQQWNYSESNHLRQLRVMKSSSVTRHQAKGVSIAGFDVIRVLGKGSFGVVRLVTERTGNGKQKQRDSDEPKATRTDTTVSNVDGTAKHNLPTGKPLSDVFAMKVIRKSEMLRACQEGHLRAERDFLVGAEGSRWVVPLIASFQDNTNLYLVMEYMIGGDFLGLLLREDVLDESVAR